MNSRWRWFVLALLMFAGPVSAADVVDHLDRLGVNDWHAHGWRGRGMTIAILDSGFRGYSSQLGKALPRQIKSKSFRQDGNLEAKDSDHGIACAEIVHAIAPDAHLLFANWEPDDPAAFLRAVAWCKDQGATILSCSIVMPGWSDGHGGGGVHDEMRRLTEGCLFFASAGNLAQRHWSGRFQDDGERRHVWQVDRIENRIRPWGRQPVSVEVTGSASSTYRLSVIDERGQTVAEDCPLSAPAVHGRCVRFLPDGARNYQVRLELLKGPGDHFRLIALGADLELWTKGGCMVFPGDSREVIAVGALAVRGERLPTSSIGQGEKWVKPDCVAIVPFPSRLRASPFGGTSAAAPQAAALTALLWSRKPSAKPDTIRAYLFRNCINCGPVGPDSETGHGQIHLPCP